ncbi:CAP domain-containing protein [Conexibacter woesei]|uniref:SCP-like extracellular n=1 Tax=Conexibacter woesei (strain DSM 14684 / CCUG 47730 / CIP 108061 / JCM 11494 / NBRC 100937 / ID131577) TaxID=469383 RepID=D3FAF8_CONWI|nr:CAP domain-containing protein [Conexibacter woesei]ADB49227.1 SCP-like extracellular [Conexibacter woesei DSM 14684]
MTPDESPRAAPARRPRLLALALLLLSLAVPALLAGGTGAASAAAAPASPQASAAAAPRFGPAVVAELNRIRARSGLPAVRHDQRMSRTASAHSRHMLRTGALVHGSWTGRVARAAGSAAAVGEVLGWLRRTSPSREARAVVRGWLNSAPHRHVLLDARFRRVGIGRAAGRFDGAKAAVYTVDWATAR